MALLVPVVFSLGGAGCRNSEGARILPPSDDATVAAAEAQCEAGGGSWDSLWSLFGYVDDGGCTLLASAGPPSDG